MILLYKIIFILTAFGAGVIAVDVFLKRSTKTIFEKLFGFMSVAFVVWAGGRFLVLISESKDEAIFWVHFLYIGSIFVHILFLHTIVVFLGLDKNKWNKIILILFYLLSGFLFISLSTFFVSGHSLFIKDVISKGIFPFYEVPGKFYLLHLINYLFIPTYCFSLMLFKYFHEVGERKQQIKLVMFASVVGFIGGNSVVPLVYNFNIQPILLVLVPFYLPILTFAIAKHKLFNVKVLTTELATFSLWLLLIIRAYLSDSTKDQLINLALLFLTIFVGILLIRSVQSEVKQKEKVEILAIDLERANDKLKELDNLKSEFLSLASHQIRGPLAAIKGYASEIMEGDFGEVPKNLSEPIKTIFSSCDSLTDLVEDFLNISRIEQGRMKYEMATFDLAVLVKQVINEVKPNIDAKGLELKTEIVENSLIFADQLKIKQIINNLIDNSVKYTPGGYILISVFKKEDKVIFSVKDSGVGIKKETMSKLFQKFSRAEDASEANILGTGLGLYLAKQIIIAHKGDIFAKSDGEGRGSEFVVEFKSNQ